MANKKQNDRKVPNLRFREFQDSLVRVRFGDVVSNRSEKYNPQNATGFTKCIELEHLNGGSGRLLGYIDGSKSGSIKNVFNKGDVLFGKLRPYLKKYLLAPFDGVCSSEIWVLKGRDISNEFLYQLIQTNSFIDLANQSSGSKMPRADWTVVENEVFFFPSLKEQKKIAIFLQLLDDRINTQNKIIEGLETQKGAIAKKLFDQKLRFKDINGNFYADWKKIGGGELFDSISDKNHNSDLSILAITQDKGAIPRDLIDYDISVTEKSVASYKVVQVGDFIISLRSFQGGIEYSEYMGICSPAYIILKNKIEIEKKFYKHYFKSADYIRLLNQKLEGIRDGKMISYNYFSDILVPFPSLKEQKKISNFLSLLDKKIETEKSILEQLELQKKYLLQQMLV